MASGRQGRRGGCSTPVSMPWWSSICLSLTLFHLACISQHGALRGAALFYSQEMEANKPVKHATPKQHEISILLKQSQDPLDSRAGKMGLQLWTWRELSHCRRAGETGDIFTAIFWKNLLTRGSWFHSRIDIWPTPWMILLWLPFYPPLCPMPWGGELTSGAPSLGWLPYPTASIWLDSATGGLAGHHWGVREKDQSSDSSEPARFPWSWRRFPLPWPQLLSDAPLFSYRSQPSCPTAASPAWSLWMITVARFCLYYRLLLALLSMPTHLEIASIVSLKP